MHIPLEQLLRPREIRTVSAMTSTTALASNASPTTSPSPRPSDKHNYTRGLDGVQQLGNYFFINALVVFFFVLCGLSLIVRLTKMGHNHLRHLFSAGPGRDRQLYWTVNRTPFWPWLKRHLLYAPFWKKRHNREMQISTVINMGTLPSRYQTVLLVVYVLSNFAYCAVLDYGRKDINAILAALRGRSGALAVINTIPTILFALRNNPMIWILSISYDTFNIFHRWTARVVIIEAIVHTLAWMCATINTEGAAAIGAGIRESSFLYCGLIGLVTLVTISVQAWSPLRHAFYETFVSFHRLLVIAAIAGIYIHLHEGFLPQLPYVKVGISLWILEWILRVTWILYYNYGRRQHTRVTIEALPSEACRVTFDIARRWKFSPGSHVYAYFPTIGYWSAHPFTVAWSNDKLIGSPDGEKLPETEVDLDREDKYQTSLSLVVRARTGLSRHIYDRACAAPNGVLHVSGAVEGPYGGHESLDSYGTVLLFAGGVGITHQIGYIGHLIQGCETGTVATRKIVLVWSVPNTEALEWVRPWMDEILRMKGRRDVLKVMLFITKPRTQQEVISGTGTVQMFPGRCNPQTVLDKEFVERIGAMMVTVCGPGGFADSVRHAVRRRVQLGSVDFVEQAFTW